MIKKILPLLVAAVLSPSAFAGNQPNAPPSAEEMATVLHAMFLSQQGAHTSAAGSFAAMGERFQHAPLMREAYRESLGGAGNIPLSLLYARRWHELGGGTPSLRAQAHLLLKTGQRREAEQILSQLMSSGEQNNRELFQLLKHAAVSEVTALGRNLFPDTADGNIFLARLAIGVDDFATAEYAIKRGVIHQQRRDEFNFLRMWLRQSQQGRAAAVAVADDYLKSGCPGITADCDEQSLIYAFVLFSAGDDKWREVLHHGGGVVDDAALFTGRFLEEADLPERAAPYYQKVRGRFFHAQLGLARIERNAGRLSQALQILDATAVTDDRELVLREITAADITEKLRGAAAALQRLVRAEAAVPDNHSLMYQHALLSEQDGDINGAIALLERMTQLFPNSAETWNALGYVLADHNRQLQKAEQYIKIALRLEPAAANILDSLGWVYYRQGRLQEARKYLLQAAQQSSSSEISAHLGEVYWQLGDFDLARKAFTTAKQHDPENKVLNETLRRLQITVD